MAAQRAAERHSVSSGRHGRDGDARRRRLARSRPGRARRPDPVAAIRVGAARTADGCDPRRRDLRLRPQRNLAAARYQRRRRSRRARALLERVRADGRHARVSEHAAARAKGGVRHRQGRAGGSDDRQTQRQRAPRLCRRTHRHGPWLRLPTAERWRQRAHRPRHCQRSARPLHPHDAAPHRPRQTVLWIPERQAAARGVSGADRRAADVGSARGQRVRDVAGVDVRRADGSARRRARAHRLQQPGALPRPVERSRPPAAGGRRERHARARVPAAQWIRESDRRSAVPDWFPGPRVGDDVAETRGPRPRSLHGRGVDAAAGGRADRQRGAAPLRRRARSREGRRPRQLHRHRLELSANLQVRVAAVQGGWHARHRSPRAEQRIPVAGRPQRLRRAAGPRGDQASDADACRLDACDRRKNLSRRTRISRRTS